MNSITIGDILKWVNPKVYQIKTSLGVDHVITQSDVIDDVICRKYNEKMGFSLSNYGLHFNDSNNEISFIHLEIDRLVIVPEINEISSVGGDISFSTFIVIKIFKNGIKIKEVTQKVNSLIECNNIVCSNNIIHVSPNESFNEQEINVCGKYGYGGVLYQSYCKIKQAPNEISDWVITNQEVIDININITSSTLSNKGGAINFNITKIYRNVLEKVDNLGNCVDRMLSDLKEDDVTDFATVSVNDPFNVEGSTFSYPEQEVNSPKRIAYINYSFDSITKVLALEQEQGPILRFEKVLSFDDKTINKTIKLDNHRSVKINVPILSIEKTILDNETIGINTSHKLYIKSNSDWIACIHNDVESLLVLYVDDNLSNEIRIGNVYVSNGEEEITLSIQQQNKKIILNKYLIDTSLIKDNNNLLEVKFNVTKQIIYEDKSFIEDRVNDDCKLKIYLNDSNNFHVNQIKKIDNNSYTCTIQYNNSNLKFCEFTCLLVDSNNKVLSEEVKNKLNLKLENIIYKDINLTLSISNSDIETDIIPDENTYLEVIDESKQETIFKEKINKFWINKYMSDNYFYDTTIKLILGNKYTIIVYPFVKNGVEITKKINETYIIEQDDIGIDMCLEIIKKGEN